LRQSVAIFLPEGESGPLVDMAEAVRSGWVELWYQPKIDAHTIVTRGVEGLLRIRHPAWGVFPPAYLVPADGNPSDQSAVGLPAGSRLDQPALPAVAGRRRV
jgi:sensor c-di-GMP phosphodiesterase-like protein